MKKLVSLLLITLVFVFSFSFKVDAASDLSNRADAIVEIGKLLGLDGTQRSTQFKDVPKSHYASGYIQSAVDRGIVNGYSDDTFKPANALTRGHLAAFISRAFGENLPSGSTTFKDVPKNSPYYNAVSQLVAASITTGYDDGTFKLNNQLTKAHLKTFIDRTKQYLDSNKSYGNLKGTVTWQYNKYVGTKPDVDAKVFLIPTNFNYINYNGRLRSFAIGFDDIKSNLFVGKVNGYGTYEISDIPTGQYLAIIVSKNTTRNFTEDVPSYTKDTIEKLLGAEGYEAFKIMNLNLSKHTWSTIEIKKDKTIDYSYDFGNTYI